MPDGSPIIGNFSHDSTDDILTFYDNVKIDTVFLAWFDGQRLYRHDTVYADSTLFFELVSEPPATRPEVRVGLTGDFQGTARTSFIASDPNLNLYYFENAPPFSPSAFINAMRFDTLWAQRQYLQLGTAREAWQILSTSLAMPAFPKTKGDKSVDFLTLQFDLLDTAHNFPEHIYYFRGGPEFGKKRPYLDSANYILHTPQEFSSSGFPLDEYGMHNCGDMTGTGNNVLELYGEYGNALVSFYFFYVTGEALDSKVDMAYEIDPHGAGRLDTLTADNDNLEDAMIGMPEFNSYQDVNNNRTLLGTVHLVHGSRKIPVHLNPKFSSVVAEPTASTLLELYPNPATGSTVSLLLNDLNGEAAAVVVRDLLGRSVMKEQHQRSSGAELYQMDISRLPSGCYTVEVTGSKRYAAKLVIME